MSTKGPKLELSITIPTEGEVTPPLTFGRHRAQSPRPGTTASKEPVEKTRTQGTTPKPKASPK